MREDYLVSSVGTTWAHPGMVKGIEISESIKLAQVNLFAVILLCDTINYGFKLESFMVEGEIYGKWISSTLRKLSTFTVRWLFLGFLSLQQ